MDEARKDLSVFSRLVECYQGRLGDNLISIVLFGSRARGDARETSDYDLFIVAKALPPRALKRVLFVRTPLQGRFDERFCIIAKTPEEVMQNLPPLFLDLAVDGTILFDRENFFTTLQKKLRDIIEDAGLQRKKDNGEFFWDWKIPPKKAWEITWSGYREL